MRHLCDRAGVSKIFTSAYHPACNGMIARFNRTMGTDISESILSEAPGPQYVPVCTFRCNCSVRKLTRETPYRAMFGVDCFEFDAGVNLRLRQDDEPDDLPRSLAEVHER
jgi:hypothetical protein